MKYSNKITIDKIISKNDYIYIYIYICDIRKNKRILNGIIYMRVRGWIDRLIDRQILIFKMKKRIKGILV